MDQLDRCHSYPSYSKVDFIRPMNLTPDFFAASPKSSENRRQSRAIPYPLQTNDNSGRSDANIHIQVPEWDAQKGQHPPAQPMPRNTVEEPLDQPRLHLLFHPQPHRIHTGNPRRIIPVFHAMASQVLHWAVHSFMFTRRVRRHGSPEIRTKYESPIV